MMDSKLEDPHPHVNEKDESDRKDSESPPKHCDHDQGSEEEELDRDTIDDMTHEELIKYGRKLCGFDCIDDDPEEFENDEERIAFTKFKNHIYESEFFDVPDDVVCPRGYMLSICKINLQEDSSCARAAKEGTEKAIWQYNKEKGAQLQLVEILKANKAVYDYYVTFQAKHPNGEIIPYQTQFYDHPCQKWQYDMVFVRPESKRRRRMADDNNVCSTSLISPSAAEEEDVKFGFSREEMYTSDLAGTVDEYERHVFLCFKNPDAWLPRVADSRTDPLPKLLFSAIKARKKDITIETKVTISEGGEGTEFENGDVLIFRDMIKYKSLKESEVDGFVEDVLVNGKPWASRVPDVLTGSHVFVCAHASRDKRCGFCGPILIQKLKEGIESRGLIHQVFVSACSHVGGHKYAGNLIIYSPDSQGKTMGHWYGYVTPDDVPEILDQHIGKGVVIGRIWRGKMGAVTEEGEKVVEEKLPNGKNVKESKKHDEINTEVNKENVGGCCQGANGFSCCRD